MSSKSRRQGQASGPSQRQLRIGESLRHALSEILMREELFEPDLSNVSITISEISVSPDLSNARVYTMPLGGINVDIILPALNVGAGDPVTPRKKGAFAAHPTITIFA